VVVSRVPWVVGRGPWAGSRGAWAVGRGLVALAGLLLTMATTAVAQVDPRGDVRTIVTPHFRVHAVRGLDSLARRAAVLAEGAYVQFAAELAPPAGPIDLLVIDNVDYSNGYAQVFPTPRIVVYATPPVASTELRYSGDWLRMVITHELAHIFHLDRARGVWTLGRWVFGRAPVLFPNSLTPSWLKEGLAVHYESRFTGVGRAVASEFPSVAAAAARDSLLLPPWRWSLATTRWPRGNTAYTYGTQLVSALTQGDTATGSARRLRTYVDRTAGTLVPYLLGRQARAAFGGSFDERWRVWRDSVVARETRREGMRADSAVPRATEPRPTVPRTPVWEAPDGFLAVAPRWLGADSVTWTSANGRDITGQFVAAVASPARPQRVAWRNGFDAHVRVGTTTYFAQPDFSDPYRFRTDLYRDDAGTVTRLTHDARLMMPDARTDGRVVAVQIGPASTRLVLVRTERALTGDTTRIVPITRADARTLWSDPRWSPSGDRIAATQLLASGEQRIVVIDTLGRLRQIVSGGRGVFASPSFTPDGRVLVWASDRSGRMQLERTRLSDMTDGDTTSWRDAHREARRTAGGAPARVQQVSDFPAGLYAPSVSPDGTRVVALAPRGDGWHVAVVPLDTTGMPVRDTWYAGRDTVPLPVVQGAWTSAPSRPYRPARQLWPRYWLPTIGEGRDGRATLGAMTGGSDILERHTWDASLLVEPTRGEVDGALAWRWATLGVPVLNASVSQSWDATFRVTDTAGTTLGLLARRRRFATVQGTWSAPRVRWSVNGTLGAQYEWRDFTATVDSVLGAPGSLLRRGTRYPSLFAASTVSTTRRALRSVNVEEGIVFTTNTAYRWREDAPSLGSWRGTATLRGYLPLPLPGYARHVLAGRLIAGLADTKTASEFSVGGTSGVLAELFPGVNIGDPSRPFPVRGVAPGVQRGTRAVGGTVEYKAPLLMFTRARMPLTAFADRLSLTVFSDAARAWCPDVLVRGNSALCERRGVRDGIIASAGAELVADIALAYDEPYRVRFGAAAPYAAPAGVKRGGAWYVSLGGYF